MCWSEIVVTVVGGDHCKKYKKAKKIETRGYYMYNDPDMYNFPNILNPDLEL